MNPDDEIQMRGLAVLRDAAPKMYAKIIKKYPHLEAVVKAIPPVKAFRSINEALGLPK